MIYETFKSSGTRMVADCSACLPAGRDGRGLKFAQIRAFNPRKSALK